MREMKLQDLKSKSPPELLAFAEEQEIENALKSKVWLKSMASPATAVMPITSRCLHERW